MPSKYLSNKEGRLLTSEEIKKAFVFGSGGLAKEIRQYILDINPEVNVFFVNDYDKSALTLEGYDERRKSIHGSVFGSGKIDIKRKMGNEIRQPYLTVVHPASTVHGHINHGCIVAPHAHVGYNAKLGYHVLANYGCTIGHDTVIGDMCVIGPNSSIGGNCRIGVWTYIGAGVMIKEGISIGTNTVIGMGAVVTKDVPSNVVAMGVPARWQKS